LFRLGENISWQKNLKIVEDIFNPARLVKNMFVEFAHSGKFVPILTKAYANVLGAQAHV